MNKMLASCICIFFMSHFAAYAALSIQDQNPLGGKCPATVDKPCGTASDNCDNGVCPEGKICCKDKCNKMTCFDQEFAKKDGSCPTSHSDCKPNLKWSCSHDDQCPGSNKCCPCDMTSGAQSFMCMTPETATSITQGNVETETQGSNETTTTTVP